LLCKYWDSPRRQRQRVARRNYKGKEADRLVTRSDPGVVSLVAELRGHGPTSRQQWKTRVEERKALDASQAAITLALLLTDEELDSLGGEMEMEKSWGAEDQVDAFSQGPQPAARHGEPAQVFPANTAAPDGRPRMDGGI
jgi:hypothetical protein